MKKMSNIFCPNCGAEYLPAEIYMPKSFLGEPTSIEKDSQGKIVYFSGSNMNLIENYECDYCGKEFRVVCRPNFMCSYNEDLDFDEEYTTTLKKKQGLFMLEED